MTKDKTSLARKFIPSVTADLAHSKWNIVMVGAGGTGSHTVPHLARMMATPGLASQRIGSLTVVDHDRVEHQNVGRQLFITQDVGKHKAEVLAVRYSLAFGLSIAYINEKVIRGTIKKDGKISTGSFRQPTLIIGAVDNAKGRRAIFNAIKNSNKKREAVYWFDAGNALDVGQVAWGNTADHKKVLAEIDRPLIEFVPYPPLLFPNLLKNEQKPGPSCAEAIEAEEQGPNINAQMGVLLAEMIRKFLIGQLDIHYTVIDFKYMRMSSQPLTSKWLRKCAMPD